MKNITSKANNLTTEKSKEFLEKYGVQEWYHRNNPPSPLREVGLDVFWFQFHHYGTGVQPMEFCQVEINGVLNSYHIMIYFDTILMVGDVYSPIARQRENKCYVVGCKHDYKTEILNSHNGDSRATCKVCGFTYDYNCGD